MRICPGCNEPMISGKQVFNGLLQCHWDCTDATLAELGEAVAEELQQSRINARLAMEGILPGHRLFETLGGKE